MTFYKLPKTTETFTTKEQCILCGKKFDVVVRLSDKRILTKCFHGRLKKRYFMGWVYELLPKPKGRKWDIIRDTKIRFKNKFWKVIAYTKPQQEVIYFFWKLLFGWQRWDYWECETCAFGEKTKCKKVDVPTDACYIRFGKNKIDHSDDMLFTTVRDEQVIIDYDKDDQIVGIELLYSEKAHKPCQETVYDEDEEKSWDYPFGSGPSAHKKNRGRTDNKGSRKRSR